MFTTFRPRNDFVTEFHHVRSYDAQWHDRTMREKLCRCTLDVGYTYYIYGDTGCGVFKREGWGINYVERFLSEINQFTTNSSFQVYENLCYTLYNNSVIEAEV